MSDWCNVEQGNRMGTETEGICSLSKTIKVGYSAYKLTERPTETHT